MGEAGGNFWVTNTFHNLGSFALAQGLAEADRRPIASELIHAIFHGLSSLTQTDVPAEKPTLEGSNLQDYQNMLLNNLLQAIRKAIVLLQERALPHEVEE